MTAQERAAVAALLALARVRAAGAVPDSDEEAVATAAVPVVAAMLARERVFDADGAPSSLVHVLVAASGTLYPHAFTDPRDADAATAVAEQRYGEVFGVRRVYLVARPGR